MVICINFTNFNVRESNTDYLQPVELCFTKEPIEPALEQPRIYFIQIPRFMEKDPDYKNPLECVLYTMVESHQQHKTMLEVVKMNPQLQEFAEENVAFEELCQRHDKAAADP